MDRRSFSIWKFTEYFKDKNYSLFKRKNDLSGAVIYYKLLGVGVGGGG